MIGSCWSIAEVDSVNFGLKFQEEIGENLMQRETRINKKYKS